MSESVNNNDLTIVYYTANKIGKGFAEATQKALLEASRGLPIVSISQKPVRIGLNICIGDIGQSTINIYRQALIGAQNAQTKYIGLAEDDVFYSPDHFHCHRPAPGIMAYDMNVWLMYSWVQPPVFSYKGRRNLYSLVCERDLFIDAMKERFAKWPDDSKIPLYHWSEPGKYEKYLGVKVHPTEEFRSAIPSIAFSHDKAISYQNLGTRKRLGDERRTELEHWGTASDIMKLYV